MKLITNISNFMMGVMIAAFACFAIAITVHFFSDAKWTDIVQHPSYVTLFVVGQFAAVLRGVITWK